MSKHTQAPWRLNHSNNMAGDCRPVIVGKNGRIVADAPPNRAGGNYSQVEVDFRLIAAAPQMLATLKVLLVHIETAGGAYTDGGKAIILDAIAKAEGGE